MTRVGRVAAQAKINVFLRVGARDASGYHALTTLFHRIDLADDVVVRAHDGPERTLDVAGPALPETGLGPVPRNLAFRAAEAFRARAGWPRGFAIELTKRIPVGGGLGGGSADAGATLRILNRLAPAPLSAGDLHTVARALGADVAFLASEHPFAFGVGRGDHLLVPEAADPRHALPPFELPPADLLLAVPPVAIATADAYRWLDEDRGGRDPALPERRPGRGASASVWEEFASGAWSGNDFEPVVERRYPVLRDIRERFASLGARIARLSGSGSTVFGLFDVGAPAPETPGLDVRVLASKTSARVVQVEVQE